MRKMVQGLSRFYAFTQDMAEKGYRPTTRVIECLRQEPSTGLCKALGLKSGDMVTRVCRLLSRKAWDTSKRPVELTKAIVRGDRCRYWVTLPKEA